LKNNAILKIAATYIGAIIGAGFASGQELVQFFANYGSKGFAGILLAGAGFAILGALIVRIVVSEKTRGYEDFFKVLLGKKVGWLIQIWVTLTLFIGLSIMFAGCGSIFREQFQIPYVLGVFISMLFVAIALFNGENGLLNFNMYLVPVLTIIIFGISLYTITKGFKAISIANINPLIGTNWLKASILYVSYNIVTGSVVLSSLSYEKLGKKTLTYGCILGGCCLGFLGLVMVGSLMVDFTSLDELDIPMIFVAGEINNLSIYLYGAVLWLAMLTTAAANAFCLLRRITSVWNISNWFAGLLLIFSSFPVAMLGFQGLIANFYPIFGYVGLVLIIAIVFHTVRNNILSLTSKW
jgi:uncharacterized membrane protein YkvI